VPIPTLQAIAPRKRRVIQAVLYEAVAISFVAPVIAWIFQHPPLSALALSATLSAVALAWNYVFNAAYERWEARQSRKGRTLARRIAHGVGFEGGLTVFIVPIMAVWLGVSLLEAFVANIGILAFFFFYTVAFTWVFDKTFGLPLSARAGAESGTFRGNEG